MRRGGLRALSIELTARGFGFAILEGSERLVDWGNPRLRGDTSVLLKRIARLVERYRVDVLVLEEPASSRRGRRGREWLVWAEQYAVDHGLKAIPMEADELLQHFAPATTSKHAIAVATAMLFPELTAKLPKAPKPWEGEPLVLGVFIAVARAWAALTDLERGSARTKP